MQKVWEFFQRIFSHPFLRKYKLLITIAVLTVAIPATVFVAQQQQELRQRADAGGTWQELQNVPSGTIGQNPTESGRRFQPAIVDFLGGLHVFVIGEGAEKCPNNNLSDPRCNQNEWYNVYVTSTDNPDAGWGAYKNIGGNSSSSPDTTIANGQLGVRVRGINLGSLSIQDQYYEKTRSAQNDFLGPEGGWAYASLGGWNRQTEVTYSKNNTRYKVETNSGELKIFKWIASAPVVQPTATTAPSNGNQPGTGTAPTTPPASGQTCTSGATCGTQFSRCSNTYGCSMAYFNTKSGTCSDASGPEGPVYYIRDTVNCRPITMKEKEDRGFDTTSPTHDYRNTPCHTNRPEDFAAKGIYVEATCQGGRVLPTPTTQPATPVVTQAPVATAPTTGKSCSRCSANYGCLLANFTSKKSDDCEDPAGSVTYTNVGEGTYPNGCPRRTEQEIATLKQNGWNIPKPNGDQNYNGEPNYYCTQPTPVRPTPIPGA